MRQDLYQELYTVENDHWWHQHKRNVVKQFINQFARKGKVLDIGSGTGKILEELKNNGWQVYGVDGEKEAIVWSQKRGINCQLLDVTKEKLPFADNYFDLVLALDFLEHIPDEHSVIDEIKRVVKRGGVLIITVPAYQQLFSYWDKMLGHQRRYNKKSLNHLFSEQKLQVIFCSYYFSLLLFPAVLTRFLKQRNKKTNKSDFKEVPLKPIILPLISLYTLLEKQMLKIIALPFGLSLICVTQKQ